MIENARHMLSAVAATAVIPKRVLPPRRPIEAVEYMRNVRLGHTERGSFVVTLISRVAPLLLPGEPGLLALMNEPFPRTVTRTLSKALRATKNAAAEAAATGRFNAFEQSVSAGVSANLCDSLVGMARSEQGTNSLTVQVFWAPTRPITDDVSEAIMFRPDAIPILAEAARIFREESPYEDIPIIGVVTKLQREFEASYGNVTVACVIDGKSRHVVATLDSASYQLAIDAHRRMVGVAFRATVSRDGQLFRATNISDLRIVDE